MKAEKASDIMTTDVVTADPDMSLTGAIDLLLDKNISGLPVVDDDGKLLGVITEHDVMNFAISGDAADTKIREVMTRVVVTCAPDTPVAELVNSYAARRIRRVPVIEGEKVVGIVSRRDILTEISRMYKRY